MDLMEWNANLAEKLSMKFVNLSYIIIFMFITDHIPGLEMMKVLL